MKYDSIISKLEKIIENWYDKDDLHSLITEPHDGLCDNIKDFYREGIPNEVFTSWSYLMVTIGILLMVEMSTHVEKKTHTPYLITQKDYI